MAARRREALKEIAFAIAEATVDAWLAGEISDDGEDISNDKGTKHEKAGETKAPPKRRKSPKKAPEALRKVRR